MARDRRLRRAYGDRDLGLDALALERAGGEGTRPARRGRGRAAHPRDRERDGRRRGAPLDPAQQAEEVRERILVVCPALNSAVRTWASDEDEPRGRAGLARREPHSLAGRRRARERRGWRRRPLQAMRRAPHVRRRRDRDRSRPIRPSARTGSSATSSATPASDSTCRSPTSWSTSKRARSSPTRPGRTCRRPVGSERTLTLARSSLASSHASASASSCPERHLA